MCNHTEVKTDYLPNCKTQQGGVAPPHLDARRWNRVVEYSKLQKKGHRAQLKRLANSKYFLGGILTYTSDLVTKFNKKWEV